MTLYLTLSDDIDLLVSLLEDADEDRDRVRRTVEGLDAYIARDGDTLVGAVAVDWQPDESEILYIATITELRGQGYGKRIMAEVIALARDQDTAALLVGTANASLDQIAFYQKCGFRMDSVRRDYFDYFEEPVSENGIQIRDMLVLRYELQPE